MNVIVQKEKSVPDTLIEMLEEAAKVKLVVKSGKNLRQKKRNKGQ